MTIIELRLKFESYCTKELGLKTKHFRMPPWEWLGKNSTFDKTYTNNTTEGMWKLWKKFFEEGLINDNFT